MTGTFYRRGVNSSFKLSVDDSALKASIRLLDKKGEKMLDAAMRLILEKNTRQVAKDLKSMAGNLANVSTPPTLGFKKSTNIHTKVANALKVHRKRKLDYTVHTGSTIQEAHIGVEGQRGGRLSHIVAKGYDPFLYGSLPMLVMSSTGWYKATGARNWVSTGMRMRRYHPGFYKTMDYIGAIEKASVSEFNSHAKDIVQSAAFEAGFTMKEAKTMGVRASLKGATGGTGAMAGRRQ